MHGPYAPPAAFDVTCDPGEGIADTAAHVLVVPIGESLRLMPGAPELDSAVGGRLTRLLASGEVTGKVGTRTVLHTFGELRAQRLCLVGLGPDEAITCDELRTAAAMVGDYVGRLGGGRVAWALAPHSSRLSSNQQTTAIVDGVAIGSYDPGQWRSAVREARSAVSIAIRGAPPGAEQAARRAAIVNRWVTWCRNLVNGPPNEVTPAFLAEAASLALRNLPGCTVEVLTGSAVERAGLGGLHAVGRGSDMPPHLIVARFTPPGGPGSDTRLGLVGKGVTFDSGGLSLKPSRGLQDLKCDMAGAAAVLAALAAIAELGSSIEAFAVVAACENMPSGNSLRPGEIVRTLAGTSVEVTNSDYEGRLVLADALTFAQRELATHLLDVATLTDIAVALGDTYAGLFGNDDAWLELIRASAAHSGDHAWPLPIDAAQVRLLQSDVADLKNYHDARLPMSGSLSAAETIQGAAFLAQFTNSSRWAHLDIGAAGFIGQPRDAYRCSGATGHGVRLIVDVARRLSPEQSDSAGARMGVARAV